MLLCGLEDRDDGVPRIDAEIPRLTQRELIPAELARYVEDRFKG